MLPREKDVAHGWRVGSQSRCSAFRMSHFEWRLSPVAVFAVLGHQGIWDSARSYVGVQLQVSKAGRGVSPKVKPLNSFVRSCYISGGIKKKKLSRPPPHPQQQRNGKNGHTNALRLPRQYEDVHANPDSDCYLLRVSTLNFIFTPVVMGMTLTTVSTTYAKVTPPSGLDSGDDHHPPSSC